MVTVKRHVRHLRFRTAIVRTHNRKLANISKKKRRLFTNLAKEPFETGGQLDFDRGELESAKVHFGKGSELEFMWDPDYEVSYHTHPPIRYSSIMPSYDDILTMKQTNEKEQLIFNKKIALSIFEEPKFQKVPLTKVRAVSNAMVNDWVDGMNDQQLYTKYKPVFKKQLGLDMNWHNPGKEIQLKSKSVDR